MIADNVKVIAFDLDDTLAVSKSPIDQRMAGLLGRLLSVVEVCVISGGRYEQFEKQVLDRLDAGPEALAGLHLMPTCGTRYYRWRDAGWRQVYAEDLSDAEKGRVAQVLTEGAQQLGLWESNPWGELIEDRGSQVTYSALGQEAPPDAKYAWDPGNDKKQRLRAYAAERLADLEVRVGGSTSVDVTRKGIDKAYGIRRLIDFLGLAPDQMLFVGDRLEEGGNDFPVLATGVPCIAVSSWQETADYIEGFLAARAGGCAS
ncbi:MAG TPA: HAD-IIB family hydrolase [Streptosporangiaceae bacterium]